MTNNDILQIAMEQSARDLGCRAEDFLAEDNRFFPLNITADAKKYYKLPISCNLISYGNNVVAAATEGIADIIRTYIDRFKFYHCFETPNMYWLNKRIEPLGQTACFMAEYYLPNLNRLADQTCGYQLRTMKKGEFEDLYLSDWADALSSDRHHLDTLAVGAYDNGKLVGLAGCSADCSEMWQIGVDVMPEYRRQGIASAVTSRLALEILNEGKVPFYCTAWSNIRSVRNAISSGFLPAWVEMTIKPVDVVEEMNG